MGRKFDALYKALEPVRRQVKSEWAFGNVGGRSSVELTALEARALFRAMSLGPPGSVTSEEQTANDIEMGVVPPLHTEIPQALGQWHGDAGDKLHEMMEDKAAEKTTFGRDVAGEKIDAIPKEPSSEWPERVEKTLARLEVAINMLVANNASDRAKVSELENDMRHEIGEAEEAGASRANLEERLREVELFISDTAGSRCNLRTETHKLRKDMMERLGEVVDGAAGARVRLRETFTDKWGDVPRRLEKLEALLSREEGRVLVVAVDKLKALECRIAKHQDEIDGVLAILEELEPDPEVLPSAQG